MDSLQGLDYGEEGNSPSTGYIGAALPKPELAASRNAPQGNAPATVPASPSQWIDNDQAKSGNNAGNGAAKVPNASSPSLPPTEGKNTNRNGEGAGHREGAGNRAKSPPVRRTYQRLPSKVKHLIVEKFACFLSISEVRDALLSETGIAIPLDVLAKYDVSKPKCAISQALKDHYAECRKHYIERTADVAIAHQAHRLRLVSRLIEKASSSKDFNAALKGLELAAKEMGGALSGHSVVEHRGTVGHVHANLEDARREVAMRLSQVVEGGTLLPAPTPQAPSTEENTEGEEGAG